MCFMLYQATTYPISEGGKIRRGDRHGWDETDPSQARRPQPPAEQPHRPLVSPLEGRWDMVSEGVASCAHAPTLLEVVYQELADHDGVPKMLISCSIASGERDAWRGLWYRSRCAAGAEAVWLAAQPRRC